jgi:hypothetical protein
MTGLFGKYAKFVTSIAASAVTVLSTYYGGQHWFVIVVAVLGALGVYAVPNTPKPAAPAAPKPPAA